MQNGEIFVSCENGVYLIKAKGRLTFECAPPLRNLAKNLEQEKFSGVKIELSECTWMDSTFMGVLAIIGLRAIKIGIQAEILNASKENIDLLCGLGLKKLFKFADAAAPVSKMEAWKMQADAKAPGMNAQVVLDAHETLMSVDTENVRKFGAVVNMVRQDMERKKQQTDPAQGQNQTQK